MIEHDDECLTSGIAGALLPAVGFLAELRREGTQQFFGSGVNSRSGGESGTKSVQPGEGDLQRTEEQTRRGRVLSD